MMMNIAMVTMISMAMAMMITMMMTMMITIVVATMMTWRSGKGDCAKTFCPRPFPPTNLNKLAATFKVIGPTSVFACRKTSFAAQVQRIISGRLFPAHKKPTTQHIDDDDDNDDDENDEDDGDIDGDCEEDNDVDIDDDSIDGRLGRPEN